MGETYLIKLPKLYGILSRESWDKNELLTLDRTFVRVSCEEVINRNDSLTSNRFWIDQRLWQKADSELLNFELIYAYCICLSKLVSCDHGCSLHSTTHETRLSCQNENILTLISINESDSFPQLQYGMHMGNHF